MNEYHLYSVEKTDGKFVLTSPKRKLEISGKVAPEKDGLQLICVSSAVDLPSGRPLHVSPNEAIFFHQGRNLASYDRSRLRQAVSG